MTELSGEELDRKIARIAGLVEGISYGEVFNHHWDYRCRRCGQEEGRIIHNPLGCYKPPPRYHESLDLIVKVVKGLKNSDQVDKMFNTLVEKLGVGQSAYAGEELFQFLWMTKSPARLLCEALLEAEGGY